MKITQQFLIEHFDYREDGFLIFKKKYSYRTGGRKIGDILGHKINSVNMRGWKADVCGKRYWCHRLIFLYHHGYLPKEIDHADRNPLNNRIENLRSCTSSQNKANIGIKNNNTSGYKGVHKHTKLNKWVARIGHRGKSIHIGLFDDPKEAAMAYNQKAKELFGEFAHINIISSP